MKKTIWVSALALMLPLASSGTANAACDLSSLQQLKTDKSAVKDRQARRAIKRLSRSAHLLARYGQDDACEEVVDAIQDIAANGVTLARDDNGTGMPTGKNAKRLSLARSAESMTDSDNAFSMKRVLGANVYSSRSGEEIGEIEDLVMTGDGRSVILSHGGLLGLGEKRIKVSMNDLSYNPSDNSYYVPMTEAQIKRAPSLEQVDGRWQGEAFTVEQAQDQRQQNREQKQARAEQRRDNNTSSSKRSDAYNERIQRNDRTASNVDAKQQQADNSRTAVDQQQLTYAKQAKPVSDLDHQLSINEVIGATIRSSETGKQIGEVEDMVLAQDQANYQLILSHGGFLGLGEKRIRLKMSDVDYNPQSKVFYIGMSERDLEAAPAVVKQNGRWVEEATKTDRN